MKTEQGGGSRKCSDEVRSEHDASQSEVTNSRKDLNEIIEFRDDWGGTSWMVIERSELDVERDESRRCVGENFGECCMGFLELDSEKLERIEGVEQE